LKRVLKWVQSHIHEAATIVYMASDREKDICKSKRRFPNDAAAQDALKKINPKHRLKRPYRVYKCPVCSGYHLTSQPRR
jgi:hypothetical protein